MFFSITIMFVQFVPDYLQHTDDVADSTIRILHSHVDDASVIWDAVKQRVNLHTPLPEFFPDIPWKSYINTPLSSITWRTASYSYCFIPITAAPYSEACL